MNLLCHAIFADVNASSQDISDDFCFGAVATDCYKRQRQLVAILPEGVQKGIMSHLYLDGFLEKNPDWRLLQNEFHPFVGPFSDPVFDICIDHVVAKNWNRLFDTPFDQFVNQVDQIVKSRTQLLPQGEEQERARDMVSSQWLSGMQTEEGLRAALMRIAKRIKPGNLERKQEFIDSIDSVIATILKPEMETAVMEIIPSIREFCVRNNSDVLDYEEGNRLLWKENISLPPEVYGSSPNQRL